MLKGIASFASLLRHAQQMGGKIKEISEQLRAKRATGSAGGGMVEVLVNGMGEVLRVQIDADLLARGDREMIEDLLPVAINQALSKAKQMHVDIVRSVAQQMDLPGLGEALAEFAGGGPGGNT